MIMMPLLNAEAAIKPQSPLFRLGIPLPFLYNENIHRFKQIRGTREREKKNSISHTVPGYSI